MEAISHALSILSWHENYIPEEIPPENIWDDSEGVDQWFKAVRRKQKEKFENPGSTPSTDDDDETDGNSMMGNDYADFFRQ